MSGNKKKPLNTVDTQKTVASTSDLLKRLNAKLGTSQKSIPEKSQSVKEKISELLKSQKPLQESLEKATSDSEKRSDYKTVISPVKILITKFRQALAGQRESKEGDVIVFDFPVLMEDLKIPHILYNGNYRKIKILPNGDMMVYVWTDERLDYIIKGAILA